MLVVTAAIANLIRENKTFRINSSIQTGHKLGMQLLDDHLFKLYSGGIVTREAALGKANYPDSLIAKMLRWESGQVLEGEEEEEEEGATKKPLRKQ